MNPPDSSRSRLTVALVAIALLLPVGIAVGLSAVPSRGTPSKLHASPVAHFPPTTLKFDRQPLGEIGYLPQIANVRILDLDKDGRPDVLACDTRRNRVFWYHSLPGNRWDEVPLGDEINGPASTTPVDLDGDGDLDLIVAGVGNVLPSDERIGQVIWLENKGGGKFVNHVLLDDVRRVSDVQAGDLDGDGDIDLAVAVFGYHHGEILWLENKGGGKFSDHLLFVSEGPSHVPVGDFDGDGDLDIVALVSQDHEEIWAFENKGRGEFAPRLVHGFKNFDLGSAGLIATDLDKDGDLDLLLSAGDNLEVNHHYPQPWHGVYLLENKGGWKFEPRQLAAVGGVYATAPADFDGDGDTDLVAVCMFNDWYSPGAASVVLLENDGKQQFTAKTIDTRPINLATVAAGDLNGDGKPDVVAGALNLMTDLDERTGRISVWLSRTGTAP